MFNVCYFVIYIFYGYPFWGWYDKALSFCFTLVTYSVLWRGGAHIPSVSTVLLYSKTKLSYSCMKQVVLTTQHLFYRSHTLTFHCLVKSKTAIVMNKAHMSPSNIHKQFIKKRYCIKVLTNHHNGMSFGFLDVKHINMKTLTSEENNYR